MSETDDDLPPLPKWSPLPEVDPDPDEVRRALARPMRDRDGPDVARIDDAARAWLRSREKQSDEACIAEAWQDTRDKRERRERIATQVMAGFAAAPDDSLPDEDEDGEEITVEGFAKLSVDWADALIAALDGEK